MTGASTPVRVLRPSRSATVRAMPTPRASATKLRGATAADADFIHALVCEHLSEGHLLPRDLDEVRLHVHRFVVAVQRGQLVGCADLAPLSRGVAEVRSLVVTPEARSRGLGRRLVDELVRRALIAGFEKLCAFTHAPSYFVEVGFSIVPHTWLPGKIETDCRGCAQFRRCSQYAVLLPLARTPHACVPLSSLHG